MSNRSPTKSLKNVTPQEAWSGWKPSVSHLRVFGSVAYAQVPKQLRSKLDDRSEKLLFIGYDENEKSKGYKLFNPNTNKPVISRDVEFDEEAAWDWSIEEEESYNFLPYFEEQNSTQHVSAPSPQMLSPSLHSNGDSSNSSEGPKKYISISDLYETTESSIEMFDDFKKRKTREFEMTDMGLMSYYLGIEVTQSDEGIFISQEAYTKGVLKKFNMLNVNPVITPMECGLKLSKNDPNGEKVNPTLFKSLVGSLRYFTCTRPYILFVVGLVSRFMENPSTSHLKVAKRILRYLKGTLDHGLLYSTSHDFKLMGYCDSDFAGDIDDRFYSETMLFHGVQRNNQLLHYLHVNRNTLLLLRVHVIRYG
uniref:Reverse transcriptase Ty1/copia-type domain-containing protein n=1 Tax=Chenopodium quinoa TaxID=63459 RepID=A0A803LBQ0_CHEQI